jgi:dTDP-4-amino-4,6-dideoxygalactose transaminase
MDEIQASILLAKFQFLDKWIKARRRIAKHYSKHLKNIVETPKEHRDYYDTYYLYVIKTLLRDNLKKYLADANIGTGIHYPTPSHLQPSYSWLNWKEGDFPVAEKLSETILSLPMFPTLHREEQNYIIDKIKEFFEDPLEDLAKQKAIEKLEALGYV